MNILAASSSGPDGNVLLSVALFAFAVWAVGGFKKPPGGGDDK